MNRLTRNAVFTALALALSMLEYYVPLGFIIPVPGIKLGLANIITLFMLLYMDKKSALLVLVARCTLAGLLFGGVTSIIFSLTGGFFAFLCMAFLKRYNEKVFSVYGISMGGAAFHNIGQILAAGVVLKSFAVVSYLPVLLLTGLVTGALTAFITRFVFNRFSKSDLKKYLE